MLTHWRQRLANTVGLRLAVWYAALFLITAIVISLLAYHLLVLSLERRDHDLLLVKLAEYGTNYEQGGLPAVNQALGAERAAGSAESVLVRVVDGQSDVLFLSRPPEWRAFGPRCSISDLIGRKARASDERKRKAGGRTPTTFRGIPFMRVSRPRTFGSESRS